MVRVFLSHSRKDTAIAKRIAQDLQSNGFEVWFDEWEIKVGHSIPQRISEGLRQSDFVVLLLSHHSVASGWVEKEWMSKIGMEAKKNRTTILPVRLDRCRIPDILQDKRCADISADYRSGLRELVDAITYHSGAASATTSGLSGAATDPVSPEDDRSSDEGGFAGTTLLGSLWRLMEPDLQDAFSLAYNQCRREGLRLIKTRYLFAAMRRLNQEPLRTLLESLPAEALPAPIRETDATSDLLLHERPGLSGCVADCLSSIGPQASEGRKLTSRDVFVDIALHGTGGSVKRLRASGIAPDKIEELVTQLGWTVIGRAHGPSPQQA